METVPEPAIRLDEAAARTAPAETGVYATWITDTGSLSECGITGPEPRVVYIGKASGSRGLRSRLLRHAQQPFWSLLDLLASRGTILPAWWHYADKRQPHTRTFKTPPLAKLVQDAALAWQHDHLRWGWRTLAEPRPAESVLIAQHLPLLNLHGHGFSALGPPQLRLIGEFEPARAAWLFSTTWIAALTVPDDGWSKWTESTSSVRLKIDEEGWPLPLHGRAKPVKLTLPTERVARRILKTVRNVQFNAHDNEALAWWSAYAGLAFRPRGQSVRTALRHAFRREIDALDLPASLPPLDRRTEILSLIKSLPTVAH